MIQKILQIASIVLCLAILADFLVLERDYEAEIVDIKKEYQQYYNAAGNHHFSYKIETAEHSFYTEEENLTTAKVGDPISYSVSILFKEVNQFRFKNTDEAYIPQLRLISGCVLPIVVLIIVLAGLRFGNRLDVLVFIAQTLLLGDLIFLMS